MSPGPSEGWTSAELQADVRPVGITLSPGCFEASELQRQQYAQLVRGRVDAMLNDEAHYAEHHARHEPFLHPGEWKQVKKEKQLTFYRRVQRGRSLREMAMEEELPEIQRAVERGYTSMICDGFVEGSIEDMMFGMTASSQEDLMTGFSFKNPPKDCVWLGSVDSATEDKPFRSADLIWALPKLPPVLDQVDVCYLKATGVEQDEHNETYGYLVLHGVHIAQCPSYEPYKISRAKMYFACLFREPAPGMLKVTVRGIFDLSRKVRMLKGLVSAATQSIMIGLLNGVGIGQAKKLTLLMRHNHALLRNLANSPRQSMCYVCTKRASLLGRARIAGMHLVTCQVCGGTVCTDCTRDTKHRVFQGSDKLCSSINCCPNCIRDAAKIHVNPGRREFQVLPEVYLKDRSRPRSSSAPQIPTPVASSTRGGVLKTNLSTGGMQTSSTVDESLADESQGDYRLDFDDDPFSISLNLTELRRSSGDGVASVDIVRDNSDRLSSHNEGSVSSPEAVAGSFTSEITVWGGPRHRISIDDDDFLPATASDRMYADRYQSEMYENARLAEDVERRLRELNIRAEHTFAQTQETLLIMRQRGH